MKFTVTDAERDARVAIVDDQEFSKSTVEVRSGKWGSDVYISTGGRRTGFLMAKVGDVVVASTALGVSRLQITRGVAAEGAAGGRAALKVLKSSMPGKVLKILVQEGDTVAAGQPLLIIEAMKMENEIRAQHAGKISKIAVQVGKKIETGELLISFEVA